MANFPISSTTWTFGELPLPEAIRHLADIGFDGVDIPVGKQMEVDATSPARRKAIRKTVEDCGLVFTGFHWAIPPGLSYSTPDQDERLRTVAYFNRVIDMAEEMGVRYITLGCGYTHRIAPEWHREEALRNARDSWERWARHLEGKQVQVGLEVLSRLDVNVLNTVEECARFLTGLTGERLGLTLDVYHMNIEESDLYSPISRFGHLIKVFQVADNHRNTPGTGHLPWRNLLAMLQAVNYPGFLSFEIPPNAWGHREQRDAVKELTAGLRYLRETMHTL
ncbi:MAG: sugar phosphate isomerase/epimerase [Deltaproteobacteria bacterium]|nr:sugar phosphate isomerase/epimerase [Deltaproteobacteria bacterium]